MRLFFGLFVAQKVGFGLEKVVAVCSVTVHSSNCTSGVAKHGVDK